MMSPLSKRRCRWRTNSPGCFYLRFDFLRRRFRPPFFFGGFLILIIASRLRVIKMRFAFCFITLSFSGLEIFPWILKN